MGPGEIQGEAARQELERVLASPVFARSERLSRLLRFLVERHLQGRDAELKESLIAIEVFGRQPDYDPKLDSIVRSEAARLRSRLIEYYAGEGSRDPLVIELPKGGYTPRFRQPEMAPAGTDGARKTHSRQVWLAAALAVVALAATGWWWVSRKSAPIAIAVMPLENLSHDPANDYFADGLTDELIRSLSLIDELAPRSRTSSFAFKGRPRNVHEVGKQLGADYIVEGSVLRAGQQLRINVQLIRVRDDFPLWTGRYEREVTDVFRIQDEISRGVVNSLRLKLGRGRRRYETSAEAYDLYLRARALKGRSLLVALLNERAGLYQEAIDKDPTFAPAYAGLASTYAFRSGFSGLPELDRPSELAKMRAAAQKAIQLDPLLAEAHSAQGAAYARDAQWDQSEKSFRRALDIDPNSSESRDLFVIHLLLPLGRIEEAVRQMKLAEQSDPLSAQVHNDLAYALRSAGRYDEAATHCEKAANRALCLGRTRLAQGRIAEAIDVLTAAINRDLPAGEPIRAYLGNAYARAGRREEAGQIARALAPFAVQQAVVFAGLGDKDRTLEALDRGSVFGPVRLGRALANPEFDLIRGDPRVKVLRKRVGLPD